MTNPDAAPSAGKEPRERSGTQIVVGMLVLIVVILWAFDLIVSAFGPPEAGMQVSVRNDHAAELRVLVCGDPVEGWAQLFGRDARLPAVPSGGEQSVQVIEGLDETWTVALQWLEPDAPPAVLIDLRADSKRQLFLRGGPQGEVTLRDGPALVSNARQHMLKERSLQDWPILRSRSLLPELPGIATEPLPASDSWAFGPLLEEPVSEP